LIKQKLPTPNIKEINYAELKRAGSTKPDDWDPEQNSPKKLMFAAASCIPSFNSVCLHDARESLVQKNSSESPRRLDTPTYSNQFHHLSMNYCFILYSQPQISLTGPRLVTITQIESIPALEKYVQLLYYVRVRQIDVNVEKNNCCTLWSITLSHSTT